MNIVNCFNRFYLDDDAFLDHEVGDKISNQDIPVTNFNPVLLGNLKVDLPKFDSQRIFINLFEESGPERIANLMGAADDLFRNLIKPRSVLVSAHWRLVF